MEEKRLVNASALLETQFTTGLSDANGNYYGYTDVVLVSDIKNAPTVDAVEVVRCKDCIHWDSETGWCNNHSAFDDHDMDWNIYNDDDFCSYGERRTDGLVHRAGINTAPHESRYSSPVCCCCRYACRRCAPVRHGKWLFVDNDGYWYNECSVCGGRTENHDGSPPGFNYCPDCGAKMDLEV